MASLVLPSYRPTVRTGIAPTPTFMENPLSTAAVGARIEEGIAEIPGTLTLKSLKELTKQLQQLANKSSYAPKVEQAYIKQASRLRKMRHDAQIANHAPKSSYVPKEYRPWTFKEQVLHGNGEIPTAYIEGGLKFH